ncbi:hypothetical protein BDQ17DRAFT_1302041 [Cyathus striatus]|nr:hypothetical protein BDQ17DRAFT_1302041 [Cyathus striatus]
MPPVVPPQSPTGPRHDHVDHATASDNNDDVEQPPSTPTRPNNPVSVDEYGQQSTSSKLITPSSRGTSQAATARSGLTSHKSLGPFIGEDIAMSNRRVQVPFTDLLKVLLKKCAANPDTGKDSLLDAVLDSCVEFCNSDSFQQIAQAELNEYCTVPRTDERIGFLPFKNFMNKLLVALEAEKANFPQLKDLSKLNPRLHKLEPSMMVHLYDVGLDEDDAVTRSPDFIMVAKTLLKAGKFKWTEILTTWELKLAGKKGFPTALEIYSKKDPKKHVFLPDGPILKSDQMSATNLYADRNPNPSLPEQPVGDISSSRANEGASAAIPAGNSKKRSAGEDIDGNIFDKAAAVAKRVKQADKYKNLEPNPQNASYGSEMLCRGIYSFHSLNFLVVDDVIWVWWYDRQNAIQSSGLNFVEDAPHFIALLLALQRFDVADWGVDPGLASPSMFMARHGHLKAVNVDFGNSMVVTIKKLPTKHLHLPGPVLKGRATSICEAESNSDNSTDMVVKAYWPERTRLNEAHIIKDNKRKLSEEPELIKNLPPLLASIDIPSSNTGNILRELGVQPAEGDSNERVLRLLLFRKLVPLHKVEDQRQVLQGWVQCLKCHYALWNKDTEHGDISVWNLMWDPQTNCGVLNDWDLAFVRGGILVNGVKQEGHGAERTGTMPFMARELLDDPYSLDRQRLYRHEVESFIWVITWICFKVDLPSELDSWHSGDSRIVSTAKDSTVMKAKRQYWKNVPRPFTPIWQVCILLLQVLYDMEALEIDDAKLYDTVMKIAEFKLTTPKTCMLFFHSVYCIPYGE